MDRRRFLQTGIFSGLSLPLLSRAASLPGVVASPMSIRRQPRFISFDLYGTLIRFEIDPTIRKILGTRLPKEKQKSFLTDFRALRYDEVLGAWKPYPDVLKNALRRACQKWSVEYRPGDGDALVQALASWKPHPDVPAALKKIAAHYPLVILSNGSTDQISAHVKSLEAPIHSFFSSEQLQAYKPQMKGFEHMVGKLGCQASELMHVSASFRYDLITGNDLGIGSLVYVDRLKEPVEAQFGFQKIRQLAELPDLLVFPANA